MLVFLKSNLNYLKGNIFNCFFKEYNRLFFFKYIFHKIVSLEEETIIKDIRNLFRLKKKELTYAAIKDVRNLYRLEKETKATKGRILRDIKNLFEHEEK